MGEFRHGLFRVGNLLYTVSPKVWPQPTQSQMCKVAALVVFVSSISPAEPVTHCA